ncbi:MAG: hypothetical protein LBG13_02575 [Holosporales bacterium]|nr:hypothetical protein [Holosporales bacterium]
MKFWAAISAVKGRLPRAKNPSIDLMAGNVRTRRSICRREWKWPAEFHVRSLAVPAAAPEEKIETVAMARHIRGAKRNTPEYLRIDIKLRRKHVASKN